MWQGLLCVSVSRRLPPAPGPGESSHSIYPAQVELQSLCVDGEDSPLGSYSWPQPWKIMRFQPWEMPLNSLKCPKSRYSQIIVPLCVQEEWKWCLGRGICSTLILTGTALKMSFLSSTPQRGRFDVLWDPDYSAGRRRGRYVPGKRFWLQTIFIHSTNIYWAPPMC